MASNNNNHPLTKQHCDDLTRILESCAKTKAMIETYKRAGIDMTQAEQENDGHQQLASTWKAVFFPGEP